MPENEELNQEQNEEQNTEEFVIDPILLDSTGQQIKAVLEQIKNVLRPNDISYDYEILIPVNSWSGEAPYTYSWYHDHVTPECNVKVNFSLDVGVEPIYIGFEKIAGGVRFTVPAVPSQAVPVVIHIYNANITPAAQE